MIDWCGGCDSDRVWGLAGGGGGAGSRARYHPTMAPACHARLHPPSHPASRSHSQPAAQDGHLTSGGPGHTLQEPPHKAEQPRGHGYMHHYIPDNDAHNIALECSQASSTPWGKLEKESNVCVSLQALLILLEHGSLGPTIMVYWQIGGGKLNYDFFDVAAPWYFQGGMHPYTSV